MAGITPSQRALSRFGACSPGRDSPELHEPVARLLVIHLRLGLASGRGNGRQHLGLRVEGNVGGRDAEGLPGEWRAAVVVQPFPTQVSGPTAC
jgi:hypothetical protein